jgi:murein DD-endopeptidase MepM/ murein hydrolase activator NlpD
LLKTLLAIIAGLRAFGRFLSLGFGLFVKPLVRFMSFIFSGFLVPLYSLYRKTKKAIRDTIEPLRKSLLHPFLHRHLAAIMLIGISTLIIANNIMSRDARAEQIGKQSLIGAIQYSPTDSDFEEEVYGVTPKTKSVLASLVTPAQATPLQKSQIGQSSERVSEVITASYGTGDGGKSTRSVITYTVKGGDTISTIAEQFNVSTASVLWANGMGEFDFIKPGQTLKIPPVSGVIHQVASGDTLGSIARKYNVSEDSILEYNKLADASLISIDSTLVVPGGKPPAPPAPVKATRVASDNSPSYSGSAPASAPATNTRFRWPTTSHRINQYFRYGHTGVDIDGDYSSPIYASAGGVVTKVAYLRYGYGYHVIIRHPDGTQTLYGHASKIFVTQGQQVSQGQTIAIVGSTGRSTGTHLHFEIIIGGRKVNPLGYIH